MSKKYFIGIRVDFIRDMNSGQGVIKNRRKETKEKGNNQPH
jgi:hypothetical protein